MDDFQLFTAQNSTHISQISKIFDLKWKSRLLLFFTVGVSISKIPHVRMGMGPMKWIWYKVTIWCIATLDHFGPAPQSIFGFLGSILRTGSQCVKPRNFDFSTYAPKSAKIDWGLGWIFLTWHLETKYLIKLIHPPQFHRFWTPKAKTQNSVSLHGMDIFCKFPPSGFSSNRVPIEFIVIFWRDTRQNFTKLPIWGKIVENPRKNRVFHHFSWIFTIFPPFSKMTKISTQNTSTWLLRYLHDIGPH
jgi:hypothetical protein